MVERAVLHSHPPTVLHSHPPTRASRASRPHAQQCSLHLLPSRPLALVLYREVPPQWRRGQCEEPEKSGELRRIVSAEESGGGAGRRRPQPRPRPPRPRCVARLLAADRDLGRRDGVHKRMRGGDFSWEKDAIRREGLQETWAWNVCSWVVVISSFRFSFRF